MLIFFASLGWALFVLIGILYAVGNRLNASETNSLAIHNVATILSDDYRNPIRDGLMAAILDAKAKNIPPERIAYGLVSSVTEGAKRAADGQPVNSLMIVLDRIKKSA